jgi:hypothetical protein
MAAQPRLNTVAQHGREEEERCGKGEKEKKEVALTGGPHRS